MKMKMIIIAHSEVEGMCMLAELLQKPLLQSAVWFPLLRHRREGLGAGDYILFYCNVLSQMVKSYNLHICNYTT